jgi:hypothetical protein
MMKVRFKETQSGHTFLFKKGEVYDLPRNDALGWVGCGRATLEDEDLASQAQRPVVQDVIKKASRPVKRKV